MATGLTRNITQINQAGRMKHIMDGLLVTIPVRAWIVEFHTWARKGRFIATHVQLRLFLRHGLKQQRNAPHASKPKMSTFALA